MGSKLLYTLPALLLALLALILALVGLSREPEPASAERSEPSPSAPATWEEAAHEYWVVREPVEAGETLTADKLAVVSADSPITGALSADEAIAGQQVRSTVRAGNCSPPTIWKPVALCPPACRKVSAPSPFPWIMSPLPVACSVPATGWT